ncbi:MAG TPA: preprotein translocase subunit SecY [bacterium]|nr:preprotein translocase subunit SecY [bacterium]
MLSAFTNIFRVPELKSRVLFTFGILLVYRIGIHIPIPGVNVAALEGFFQKQSGGVLGFLNLFSGGALKQSSIFALGVMPYISMSIILQLLTAVIPTLEKLSKEGEQGRRKITQYTRIGTVALCLIQGTGTTFLLKSFGEEFIYHWGIGFQIMTVIALTTGTVFIMWLGEQITEYGIGNGMSIIIFAGIVAGLPAQLGSTYRMFHISEISLFALIFFAVFTLLTIAFIVVLQQGARKIPVQYATRVVGRQVFKGQSTQLPLKVDYSGVIAVIFASSILIFPSQIARYVEGVLQTAGRDDSWLYNAMDFVTRNFSPGAFVYYVLYSGLIVFFCYFYTAIAFNPTDLSENMKKYGGFIPGIRPGQPTAEFIDRTLTRITIWGALAVCAVAVFPELLTRKLHIPIYFGGTSLLIIVGVALDTMKQIESHLLMRHYDGFMKKGRLKGRSAF